MKRAYHMRTSVASSSNGFAAIPVGSSVDEIEKLYSAFYTQRLADECRFLSNKIRELTDAGVTGNSTDAYLKRDLNRRLRIAKRLLAKRQLSLF